MTSIIYILVIVLLIVLIILGIKAIYAVDNLNKTIDEINKKIHTFDDIFDFIEKVNKTLSNVNRNFISKINNVLGYFPKFRKGDKNE